MRARHGQVDDRPHDPRRRRRRADQDGARAAPPGAAADAELRAAQPGARARAHAVLHQHRDAPLDPRRRRAAAGRRQRLRVRRHQRPRRARGVGRAQPSAEHAPPWDSEVFILEARLGAGARSRPAQELLAALDGEPRRRARRTSPFTLSPRARRRSPRAAPPGDRRVLAGRPARASSARRSRSSRDPACATDQDDLRDLLRGRAPRRARRRSCSCSPARARSTRACSPTCACTSPRRARRSTGSTGSTRSIRAGTCSATGCSRGRPSPRQERSRTEARLMELDIAVEAVLDGQRRRARRGPAAGAAAATRSLGHSTGEHSAAMAAGALDLETDERLAAFCHGLYASYADAAERHEVPAAVLLAIGADARDRPADRRAGGRRAVPGDGQLPPPGGARRRGRARPRGRARSPSARG